MTFTVTAAAGATDIGATLLDASGKELSGAYYVAIRKIIERGEEGATNGANH